MRAGCALPEMTSLISPRYPRPCGEHITFVRFVVSFRYRFHIVAGSTGGDKHCKPSQSGKKITHHRHEPLAVDEEGIVTLQRRQGVEGHVETALGQQRGN